MKPFSAAIVAILIVAGLAYALFSFMESIIPIGQPPPQMVKLLNDPRDFTPREPNPPKDPHLEPFVSNCSGCHSVRLTLTQPDLPAAKWNEVVQKMITVYGAKIEQPDVEKIVQYLASVKGIQAN